MNPTPPRGKPGSVVPATLGAGQHLYRLAKGIVRNGSASLLNPLVDLTRVHLAPHPQPARPQPPRTR